MAWTSRQLLVWPRSIVAIVRSRSQLQLQYSYSCDHYSLPFSFSLPWCLCVSRAFICVFVVISVLCVPPPFHNIICFLHLHTNFLFSSLPSHCLSHFNKPRSCRTKRQSAITAFVRSRTRSWCSYRCSCAHTASRSRLLTLQRHSSSAKTSRSCSWSTALWSLISTRASIMSPSRVGCNATPPACQLLVKYGWLTRMFFMTINNYCLLRGYLVWYSLVNPSLHTMCYPFSPGTLAIYICIYIYNIGMYINA